MRKPKIHYTTIMISNKINKRAFLLVLVLLLTCLRTTAQTSGTLVNTIIPPSPTSAVFRQFAGFTPNMSTGTVNVPIDLYTIQVGDFRIPFSLQYYTQGIKCTDNPYPAGYGWIFSPGLRITRTIMGRPDMYFPMEIKEINDFDYLKSAIYDEESHKHSGWPDERLRDTQHDFFTIHLPQGNYTFLLEKEGDRYVAHTANNNLKIVVRDLIDIEVTDGDGVMYYFGNSTNIGDLYTEFYHSQYATAWMLRKIVFPGTNREINFTWEEVRHSALRFGPFFGSDIVKDYKEILSYQINTNPEYVSAEAEGLLTNYGEYEEVFHLKQITFPGGRMECSYNSKLKPLLTRMKVINTNNSLIKDITFSYGTGQDEPLLQQIHFSDEGTYRFEYNATRFGGNLNSQDYWGYYNGKDNRSLVPRMEIKTYYNQIIGGYNTYHFYGTADRSVDPEAMKAYTLTKVIYPTGGYSAFEYEPHRFSGKIPQTEGFGSSSKFRLTEGGGLRVTRIITCPADGGPTVTKSYKYGAGESGLAKVIYEPTLDTFIDELGGYTAEMAPPSPFRNVAYNLRLLFLNPQSNYMRYAVNTPALWYDTVTEYIGEDIKKVYTYRRIIPENETIKLNCLKDFPYKVPIHYNTLFSKGCLLVQEISYRKTADSYVPVHQTSYNYAVKEKIVHSMQDVMVNRLGISMFKDGPDFQFTGKYWIGDGNALAGEWPKLTYRYNPCSYRFYYEELESEETVDYTDAGNLTKQISYTYEEALLKSKTVSCSDGNSLSEEYFYPREYWLAPDEAQQSVFRSMSEHDINNPIWLIKRSVNGQEELFRTEFALFGTKLYKPFKTFYKQNGHPEICKAVYGYDSAGNLQSLIEGGLVKRTYLWGYNRTLPVAAIDGLDYAGTLSLVGQSTLNTLDGPYWSIPGALDIIRQKIGSQGLMTSYLYEPLVGMTKQTLPNGETTSYLYDSAKRLNGIIDGQGAAVQRFAYHRRGEPNLSVNFSVSSSYDYDDMLSTTASTEGSSGFHSYSWTLKNTQGVILHTTPFGSSASIGIPLQHDGTLSLTCTVKDGLTGDRAEKTVTLKVSSPKLRFSDIVQSPDRITAKLFCPKACTIDFYLLTELDSGFAVFTLDGTEYTLSDANGQNVQLNLPAGTHSFSISLNNPGTSGGKGEIHITGASGIEIGSPSFIQITH